MLPSQKNITRFSYETAAFEGWRLSIRRSGTTFTRYFSDKQYGTPRKSFDAANKTRSQLLKFLDRATRHNGQLSPRSVDQANVILRSL